MNEQHLQQAILKAAAYMPGVFVLPKPSKHNPIPTQALLDHWQDCRLVLWRQNTGAAMMTGRGGKRHPICFGVPGAPDIAGVTRNGRLVGLEVKQPNKEPSDAQFAYGMLMQSMGAHYDVVRSITDAVAAIENILSIDSKRL